MEQTMIFDTRINNIPCKCQVLYSEPVAKRNSDFAFTVLDRKGYVAPWLDKYVTNQVIERLQMEYENQ
jgi:hypothetical protein